MRCEQAKGISLTATIVAVLLVSSAGCNREVDEGPILAGGREVDTWIAALDNPNPGFRRRAVRELGNIGDSDDATADALAKALGDSDPLVRREAVLAVVKLEKPGDAIVASLSTMSRADSDSEIRDVATRALAQLKR